MAGSAVLLPKLITRGVGMKPGDSTRILQSIQNMNSEEAVEARVDSRFEAAISGEPQDMTLSEIAAMGDIMRQSEDLEKKGDVAQSLLEAYKNQEPLGSTIRKSTLKDSETLRQTYRKARPWAVKGLVLLAGVFAAVGVLGLFSGARGSARFILGMGFHLSANFLIFVSIVALLYYATTQVNVWPLLPYEALCAPIGYMLVCGASLRVLDPNVPVWNTMFRSMISPALSAAAVVSLGLALPRKSL